MVFHKTYFVPGNILELGCNSEQVLTMKVITFAWVRDYKCTSINKNILMADKCYEEDKIEVYTGG